MEGQNMRIISGKARGTKLYTLEGMQTRPTLDRVRESLFNIIQSDIQDAIILDLFAGSGAIGLEAISRGAKKAIFCDKEKSAINIIKKNIEKTHFEEKSEIYNMDYKECIEEIKHKKIDIVYIDPPYDTDYVSKSIRKMIDLKIVNDETIMIIETDDEERIIREIEKIDVKITDIRVYGRVHMIFIKHPKRKG